MNGLSVDGLISLSRSLSHSHSHSLSHSHSHTLIHEERCFAPPPHRDECVAVAVAVAEAVAVAVTEAVAEADQSIHDQSIHEPTGGLKLDTILNLSLIHI